ncbi:MAG TPA: glycosyltransferase family 4 protein [Gemmatimonadaceae bacterium]|nr:glycosyltransferase family 4 protein [Gemmatimonadaceae bacterium]
MTADTVGGVWSYALELARGLEALGVGVALATMGAPVSAEQAREAARVGGLELFESRYRLEWMEEPWSDVEAAGEWLLDLEQRTRPDVVHLNGYVHGALPWRAPAMVVAHSCVLSWWRAVRDEDAPPSWSRYREAVASGLGAARLVVAPTRAMLEAAEHHYGPLPASRVIPNGRDPAGWTPLAKEPLVLAAGRLWDEAKNVAALDRVAPALPWPVYVAGEERHPEGGTPALAAARPLGRLAPEALARWMGRAALYALPARYEPFGLSALEAALCGCALVLGDIASLRESWEGAAHFVPAGDDVALRCALRDLIAHPARREALAMRARERALSFGAARMADAYVAAYRAMTAAGREPIREEAACAS